MLTSKTAFTTHHIKSEMPMELTITTTLYLAIGLGGKWYVIHILFSFSLTHLIYKDLFAKDSETHGAFFCPIILGSDKTMVFSHYRSQ